MIDSNLLIRFVIASLIISSLTVVVLLVALVAVRAANAIARRRRTALTERWRAVFITAYTGAPAVEPLPVVGRRDWFIVFQLFEQFHDIREHDRARAPTIFPLLDAMATAIGLDTYALDSLKRGDAGETILALSVLGHLRDARAFAAAVALCENDGPEVSRAAAHCALRIDPEFIDGFLELVRRRDDWSRSRVEAMLREIDPDRLNRAMTRALETLEDADGSVRLLDYMRLCSPAVARAISLRVLAQTMHVEAVAAALRSLAPLANDADRDIALTYCRSSDSSIALGGLRVLRKCVLPSDDSLLCELTAHRDYWVRLRAAEVVVQLYGTTGLAEAFAHRHPDRYARDAVQQAIAERKRSDKRQTPIDRRGPAPSTRATPVLA